MATLLQRIGSALGLGDSEPHASGNITPAGTANAAFHLDLHQSGPIGEQVFVADPRGATLVGQEDERAIMVGGNGDDRLTGGSHSDLLIGGEGVNVMNGGGGTDVFGHAIGAIDVLTDFSPSAGERIALQDGVTLSGSTQGITNPADFGLSGPADHSVMLSFSDGSHLVLLHSTDTPDPGWFI